MGDTIARKSSVSRPPTLARNRDLGAQAVQGPSPFLPLSTIRVVDFGRHVAGSHASRILADLGAETIRVESFHSYDPTRSSNPIPGGEPASLDRSPLWININRNKRSVSLNLWHPEALGLLKRLVSVSDILVENFHPRVTEAWGLAYKDARKLNPALIYVSITGFGHQGRHRDYITFGPTAQALTGQTFMSGFPGREPAGFGFSYLDHMAGYNGAIAALAALEHRQVTGRGQHVDVTQIETGVALTGPSILDRAVNGRAYRRPDSPPGNQSAHRPACPEGIYPCRGEDAWCAIAVEDDDAWRSLAAALGYPAWMEAPRFQELAGRLAHREEVDGNLAGETRRYAKFDLMAKLQAEGVAAGVVQSPEDRAERDPQLAERGLFATFQHPDLGACRTDGLPFLVSGRRAGGAMRPPPRINEDNDHVLGEILGLSGEEFRSLEAEGAVA